LKRDPGQHVARTALILVAAASSILAAQTHEVKLERNVLAKMRDGVNLYADICRPTAEGKFPVLLERTPYDKKDGVDFCLKAAARGYLVVIQDVRGRYSSEGEWYPFKHESNDGYDTVEWAAALPFSSGKIGMFGGSYVGATQLLAAISDPPHLAGIFPQITASNYHDGWTYQSGAFEQWFSESWTSILAWDTLQRRLEKDTNPLAWSSKLPLTSYPILEAGTSEGLASYFFDWLQHPRYDDYWKAWSIADHYRQIAIPAYHVGGWYDIFLNGTLRNYVGLKVQGANEGGRHGQRLMIGPWSHGSYDSKTGDADFGPAARIDDDEVLLRWYDHVLKGVQNGVDNEKPVKIFVMGKNVWRDEDDWPLPGAEDTCFYLHSGGQANTLSGNGVLNTIRPQSEAEDRFTYIPSDPVPTRGGGLCCDTGDYLPPGAFDQRPNESRQDVLVYTTPALQEDMEATGPISLDLYASSSAVDTDFTAKLIDVHPDGYAQNLTDGILRARYRNSQEKAEFMERSHIYELKIDAGATSNVFLAGHRIRLEISSSNFPRFDRNLNTAEEPERGTRWVKATNAVYHNHEYPSALSLPVIHRKAEGMAGR
jgi:putative CocE/NonD family hydrolase